MTVIADLRTPQPAARPRAERLSLERALSLGEASWEQLRAQGPNPSPFSSWAWHQAWHATAPVDERDNAFAVATFGGDGAMTALLPLATRRITFRRAPATALTWAIGDVGCPDHLDVLATPGRALDDVMDVLDGLDWDLLQLDGLVDGAPGARALQAALDARGMTTAVRQLWRCPYIDLPPTWNAYLAERSSARRETIRRRERALGRHGHVAVTFYGPESHDEAWHHLLRLHDSRWKGDGAFDARTIALHRHFAAHLALSGRAWLSTIDVDGEAVAAWYGFVDRNTLHYYQAGRSPEWNKFGVGGVHLGLMIQRAIAQGLDRFDLLRGDEPYKADWSTGHRYTYQLLAFRRSTRGRMLRFADRVGLVRERVAKRAYQRDHAEDLS